MFYVHNANLTASTKSTAGCTAVADAAGLATTFTTAQLNRLSENELGKTYNKVARGKMAEKIFTGLEEKLVAAAPKKTKAKAAPIVDETTGGATELPTAKPKKERVLKGPRKYRLLTCEPPAADAKVPPQLRQLCEIFSAKAAESDDPVELTKDELLQVMIAGGFVSKGNAWNNVMFYRMRLIELGCMER